MTTAELTEAQQMTAILAVLNEALDPVEAFEYGTVPGADGNPGTRPTRYVLIDITRRYVGGPRRAGVVTARGFRVGTRYVAKDPDNAALMRTKVTAVLENKKIPAGDNAELGPFAFESSDAIQPDDGYQSGADVWTY